jgi:hypothetical protein
MRWRPLIRPGDRDEAIGYLQHRIVGYQRRGVPVGAETKTNQIETLRQQITVPGRRVSLVSGVDRHRDHVGRRPAEALPQVREIAVGIRRRRDALVHLVQDHLFPWHVGAGELIEHRPRGVSAAHREREPTVLGHGSPRALSHVLSRAAGDRVRVRQYLDLMTHRCQPFFSAWPPNSLRIADSTL